MNGVVESPLARPESIRPDGTDPLETQHVLAGSAMSEAAADQANAERARRRTMILLSLVLLAAVGFESVVLYWVADPAIRIGLGLLPLVPIMWASSRLGIVDRFARALDERRRTRRYLKLRARVNQMLDEIKRMNWVVVDMTRGFCSEEAGQAELEAIQVRLDRLVSTLNEVAGVEG